MIEKIIGIMPSMTYLNYVFAMDLSYLALHQNMFLCKNDIEITTMLVNFNIRGFNSFFPQCLIWGLKSFEFVIKYPHFDNGKRKITMLRVLRCSDM